jgi:penicillin amidase
MKAMRAAAVVMVCACTGPGVTLPDGWPRIPGRGDAACRRDELGIPHIVATTVEGAFFAEGYLEAQDRMWQMETLRRTAKGESAELLGKGSAASDLDRRRRGYTEAELQAMFDRGNERFRSIVKAYCAGVNAFLKEGPLPARYAELKHVPREWRPTDCVAIGVAMARRFGESGDMELQIAGLYAGMKRQHGEEKANLILRDLLRDADPTAPTTLNDQAASGRDAKGSWRPPAAGMSDEAFAAYAAEMEAVRAEREALGVPVYSGSNAWAVAAKKSASGNAMLYGGPMMGFAAPSICNQVHLTAPGLDVAGMSFPGVPGVMIGFNASIAFTTTTGVADLVDVFVLELNPENDLEYRHHGAWRRLDAVEIELKVAGEESRRETVYRSHYGPLAGQRDLKNHRAHALAMPFWMTEARTFEAVMEFNFARSVAEFSTSVSKVTTSHNWFCADRDGHIGFWYSGAHPVRRRGHDPRFPQAGDGSMDWEGILPFEKWPQSVDPANGFFTNWNNKPARAWEPTPYGKIFWGKRMADVLGPKEKVTFDDVQGLAREAAYWDFTADYFLPYILDVAEGEMAARLREYDRVKRDGAVEPAVVERWVETMMRRVMEDEVGPALSIRGEMRAAIASVLLYVLEGESAGVKLKHDWAAGVDLKGAAKEAFAEAAKAKPWREAEVNFGERIGKVKSERGRGTFQMAVELTKEGPRAVTLSAPGQSEDPSSAHYADQVERFRSWTYRPFPFGVRK